MPIFQNNFDDSEIDEAYIALMAKPTNDEVGADIETQGHVPVTPENATQDPFTQKGSLANALDDLVESSDADKADDLYKHLLKDEPSQQTYNTLPEMREVSTGELTGETEGIENNEVQVGEDKVVSVKDSLVSAFDEAFAMDSDEEPTAEEEQANEEFIKKEQTPPKLPNELKDEDKSDGNGLVYITRVFTIDPEKYLSTNYRPVGVPNKPKVVEQRTVGGDIITKEEVTMEEESSPDAKFSAESPDEPTERQEAQAAKEADRELNKGVKKVEKEEKGEDKDTEDSAPESEKVALDYATYIDGSSFCCCDEINGIDYSKITMDAGPRKKVTRENCQTTFAQCRAVNPLFCRFHGPKLIEADIRTNIKGMLGKIGAGVHVSVTKDKGAKDPMTFRLTIGCAPFLKKKVEEFLDTWFDNAPGITEKGGKPKETDKGKLTQEFDMDILMADRPPSNANQTKAERAIIRRDEAVAAGRTMPLVGETPERDIPKEDRVEAKGDVAVAEEPDGSVEVEATEEEEDRTETPEEPEGPKELEIKKPEGMANGEGGEVEEKSEEEQIAETEPMGELAVDEPPEEGTANGSESVQEPSQKASRHNPYSYEAYGEQPNDDETTNDIEPGGSGDVLGSELLQYVRERGHLLNLPKNWGKYASALARWNRALKTGGLYHGKQPTKTNRPTMNQFGISDPMADWINNLLDGGLRKGDRGTFISLFGYKPREGSNDAAMDDLPPEAKALYDKDGPEAVAEAYLKARDGYAKWVNKAKEAFQRKKEAQKKEKAEGKRRHFDKDDILSLDEIEARGEADREYDEAFAAVERYDEGSPEIQNFSREKMSTLKDGDKIRFDHSEEEFLVKGYDTDDDILTVVGFDGEERYRVSPEGIERIYDDEGGDAAKEAESPSETQTKETKPEEQEGVEGNGQEAENGVAETVVGNEEGETGGEGTGEEGEGRGSTGSGEIYNAEIGNAADAMTASVDLPVDEIKEGLEKRLDGKEKVGEPVLDLVQRTLPKGDPVREAIEAKAESEGFSLESVSAEELNEEKRRNAERAEIKRRKEGELHGSSGETGQGLLDLGGEEGEDLFNRVQATVDNAMKGNPSPEVREIAAKATEAVEKVGRNEEIASELDDFLSEMEKELDGGDGAIIGAAIEGAIEEADERAEEATEDARDGLEALEEASEEAYRQMEKVTKGSSAAKVERSLTDLAKSVFTEKSKSDKIGDEAESVATSVSDYAKEKGIEHELSQPVREVIDDVKRESEKLEGLMVEYQKAMQATGTEFQGEDVDYISGKIGRIATDIANKFGLLRAMEGAERKRIDDAVEVKKRKEELRERVGEVAEKVTGEATEGEGKEKASGKGEKKETVGSKKEAEESEKPKARDEGNAELRKAAVQASRRLGMDAYKSDEELNKMLTIAKRHLDNPRQAQRAKDIETVLKDRAVKGKHKVTEAEKLESRLAGVVKDEMPSGLEGEEEEVPRESNRAVIMKLVLEALEG